ncbi:glycosyltransferase family 2 protein [Paucihalobacter ruber]|uniref:Glycosyltransferase family 2 protein n=1 Tax=Paucihalobacter ruber TaxID=2567861 RepID=A0A506PM77_9FLAO|nr:glycosyltransferase family 2 protein [Paucihalobacter ruber]TPV33320.1 glycosyltransferase family 2 protein [Paucihalobacter ruber]
MNQPLISILTPFKNTAEFLPECLNSIISQSYQNWELLIVDDYSTDNSYQIVEKFAQNDNRIKLFKNNDHGIIEALKTAYSNSEGNLITRMDSDDVMASAKLETMAKQLLDYGKGHIALGFVKYFSEEGISDGYSKYENWLNNLTENGNNYSDLYKECVIASPCWMVYKTDLDRCNAFNPNRYPEDYDLVFRFYEAKLKCIPSSQILHYWRDYSWRTSRTHEHYAMNYFLDIKMYYFLKLNFDSSRPLALLGAGFKGKVIASHLVKNNVPFHWICDNPKKIGRKIYDVMLHDYPSIETLKNPQIIVSVANADAQKEIKQLLNNKQIKPMEDYFFFC